MSRLPLCCFVLPALALGGCNFARFDELKDDAPAQVYGNPFGGDQFGPIIVGTRPLTGTGKLAIASVSPDTIATFTFQDSGARDKREYDETDDIQPGASTVTALAAGPGGEIAVAVGDDPSARKVILFNAAGDFAGASNAPLLAVNFGLSVALADVHRVAAPSDYDIIALGSEELFMYPETGAPGTVFRCLTGGSANHPFGAVVAADFEPNAVGSPAEIAIGRPQRPGTTGGSVLITAVTGAPVEGVGTSSTRGNMCAQIRTLNAPGGEASFGERLLVGQLVGGPELDLIVGAPREDKVYVYPGGATGLVGAPILVSTAAATSLSFGSSLAIVDLDGAADSQLAVGEPLATVDGQVEAGRVHVFSMTGTPTPVLGSPLFDRSPNESARFGAGLAALRFAKGGGTPLDQLIVGARENVFVYWTTGLPGDVDDRVR